MPIAEPIDGCVRLEEQLWIHNKSGKECFMKTLLNFLRDEEGLTTVEYAVAGALVAATVVLAFTELGEAVEIRIRELITAIS
jgi:pilus assembly protein Flp/PilA